MSVAVATKTQNCYSPKNTTCVVLKEERERETFKKKSKICTHTHHKRDDDDDKMDPTDSSSKSKRGRVLDVDVPGFVRERFDLRWTRKMRRTEL